MKEIQQLVYTNVGVELAMDMICRKVNELVVGFNSLSKSSPKSKDLDNQGEELFLDCTKCDLSMVESHGVLTGPRGRRIVWGCPECNLEVATFRTKSD